jgi:anaerobic selenocysteine-containing dehydrogenase
MLGALAGPATVVVAGQQSFILPCLGRTELDIQAEGRQAVTVEDSMSMVHASRGGLKPASEHLLSEPAIIAGLAKATLPASKVDWTYLIADYGRIRDNIEAVFADFAGFNEKIKTPGGFRLHVAASAREWRTPSGKANFLVVSGLSEDPALTRDDVLTLTTVRSHDQYNTTIYGLNDRYRGVTGRRDVVFVNEKDLVDRGLRHGDSIELEAVFNGERPEPRRVYGGLTAVAYNIAVGSIAAYYPEANVLTSLADFDLRSGTPSYKGSPQGLFARTRFSARTENVANGDMG